MELAKEEEATNKNLSYLCRSAKPREFNAHK